MGGRWLLCAAWAPPRLLSVINCCFAGGGEVNWGTAIFLSRKHKIKPFLRFHKKNAVLTTAAEVVTAKKRHNTLLKLQQKWEFWVCKIFSLKFLPSSLHRSSSRSRSQNNHKADQLLATEGYIFFVSKRDPHSVPACIKHPEVWGSPSGVFIW